MSRTTRYKILYVVILVVVGLAAVAILRTSDYASGAFILVMIVLLLPGRIQGHYWRDFFRGRRLVADRRFREAEPVFERFLARLNDQPTLKRLIWLSYAIYTRDIGAMSLNNLGVCALEEGRFGEAEKRLQEALSLDSENPLPHFNLAIVYQAIGRPDEARRHWAASQRLGYRCTPIDLVIHKAGELLSRLEGHGSAPTHGAA